MRHPTVDPNQLAWETFLAPSRTLRTFRTLLTTYRLDTLQKAFARLAPAAVTVVMFAVLFPTEFADHWGKVASAAIAWLIVAPIIYVWAFRTLPQEPRSGYGLSPLYTVAGRQQFRAEQTSIKRQSMQLLSQSAQLDAEMAGLDLTTVQGQKKLRLLSQKKMEVDEALAKLKPTLRDGIGFTTDR
ncbi:hypothetical protein [Bradyrhizobium sp. CCBAU 51753]|uniref:hypothetical protein n=1 Tax=Bradyrhizobium sp. CCBAU 51753 TaxID=1325100 RepID=UPI001889DE09|nr:hypothetical protein [Bradyrhizobium sp. CCBAU 51753]QOZ25918.1 hypothetical protein XH93_21615 [Bradyrhizobium sp. CCBAU 51753]